MSMDMMYGVPRVTRSTVKSLEYDLCSKKSATYQWSSHIRKFDLRGVFTLVGEFVGKSVRGNESSE